MKTLQPHNIPLNMNIKSGNELEQILVCFFFQLTTFIEIFSNSKFLSENVNIYIRLCACVAHTHIAINYF